MKKCLLMAAILAGSISANAQVNVGNPSSWKSTTKLIKVDSNVTRSTESSLYYFRPMGMFYSGWNKELRNAELAFCPANTDVAFTAFYEGEVFPLWGYPTGDFNENGEPLMTKVEGDNMTLNLPDGTYFTPILQNRDDEKDFFMTARQLLVGGSAFQGEVEVNGEMVCNDAFAANYMPEGVISGVANYFCTNDKEADATAGEQLMGGDKTYKTLGFAELFIPTATMYVRGFNTLVFSEPIDESNIEKLKCALVSVDAEGKPYNMAENKDFEYEIIPLGDPSESLSPYYINCTLKGDDLKVEAGQPIYAYYGPSRIKLTPVFDGQKKYDQETDKNICISTAHVNMTCKQGKGYLPLAGLGFSGQDGNTVYLNSWCIGLNMSYAANGFAGIDNVVADEVAGNGAVYTLEGVKVSNGDVQNLPAGVYVKDGKKFVVR